MNDLQVTDVEYYPTKRGLAYKCTTNIEGVYIWNTGGGGCTFIEGTWAKIKKYQHLREIDLENLIDDYEVSMVIR